MSETHVLAEHEYPIIDVRQELRYRRLDPGTILVQVVKIREVGQGYDRERILLSGTIPASPDETDET